MANFASPHPPIAACSRPAPKRARTECGCKWRISWVVLEVGSTRQSHCPLITSRLDKAQFRSAMDRLSNAILHSVRPQKKAPPGSGAKSPKGLPRRWLPTIKASLVAAITQPDSDTYSAAGPLRRRPRCSPSAKGAYGESGGG